MEKINIYEAKTHLSKLLNSVATTGEPFLIARNGKVIAKSCLTGKKSLNANWAFLLDNFLVLRISIARMR